MTGHRARCAAAPAPARRARATAEIPLAEGRAPEWVTLLTPGPLPARDGRRWRLDDPAAVVAASRARAGATDILIDYEHQSDAARFGSGPVPAAGWIRALEVAPDGAIRARVQWTERARAALEAREYRYVSPVFLHDAEGVVQAIIGAALTGVPALDLPALARDTGDPAMPETLRRLLARLGIDDPDAPDEAAVTAALARLDGGLAPAERRALATALGAPADAAPDALLARARTLAVPDPAQYVPRAEYARLEARVQALDTDAATRAVDAAVAGGQLAPASREWALGYARQDLDGFRRFLAAAPVVLSAGARDPGPGRGTGRDDTLTAEEAAVCRALGVSEQSYRTVRTAQAAAGAAS